MASLRCSIANISNISDECGTHSSMPSVTEYCSLSSCTKSVAAHLRYSKSSSKGIDFEWQVILARVGKFDLLEECPTHLTVCPKHPATLGLYYKGKHGCQHPQHKAASKAKCERGITLDMSRTLFDQFGVVIPLGSSKILA